MTFEVPCHFFSVTLTEYCYGSSVIIDCDYPLTLHNYIPKIDSESQSSLGISFCKAK